MIKRIAKGSLRGVAAIAGPHRWRRGPCLLVLTYHRVLPDGHPARESEQPGMLVSPEVLAMHFEVLKAHFRPVHLIDWLRAARNGEPPPGRSVAITFDDGWRDNYDHAFPVIKVAQMPVTLFVVTDMVGSRYQFWPNRLARVLKCWAPDFSRRLDEHTTRALAEIGFPFDVVGSQVTPELIDRVIVRCKVNDDSVMHALLDKLEAVLPAQAEMDGGSEERDLLNWREIKEMADSGLVNIGSHTRRHTRLREGIDPDLLEDEVAGSRRIIEEKLGRPAPLFCYPNGDCSREAYCTARERYEGAVSTQRGWHTPGQDSHLVRRISMHEDVSRSPSALRARVSGWRGV
jgi:peptidoglycan/xylan/chitin deacetylase (PgdA/CDA1 family)